MDFEIDSSYALDQFILDQSQRILCIQFINKSRYAKKIHSNPSFFKNMQNLVNVSYAFLNQKKIFDFNSIYELDNISCFLFIYKNKKITIDLNSGDNNKLLTKNSPTKNLPKILSKINIAVKKGKFFITF